jgi:hypothetical protein
MSKKESSGKNIFEKILRKIKKNPLRYQGRPQDIPATAPDCGWNHGEHKEK